MQIAEQQGPIPAVSRNLFAGKYTCTGEWQADQKAEHDAMHSMVDFSSIPPVSIDRPESYQEYRDMVNPMIAQADNQDTFKDAAQWCDTRQEKIPTAYGNDVEGRVLCHVPKNIKGSKGNVAFISVHGGGAIAGSPELQSNIACYQALTYNALVFNPAYRLADSGATADQMANDIIAVIKWIRDKAMFLGVDPNKICLHGCSGGGYAISAACSKLALNGEGHLIKMAIIDQCVTPAYYFSDKKEDMTEIAQTALFDGPAIVQGYATDLDKQWADKDPVLFPTEASDEVLQGYPITMLIGAEYDQYVVPMGRWAQRLAQNQRLVEHLVYPGSIHAFQVHLKFKMAENYWYDTKQAVASYVTKIN